MPSFVVPSCAQIKIRWVYTGNIVCCNVLGASYTPPKTIDQTLANSLGAAIKASFTSSGLAPLSSTSTQLVSVGVRDVNVPNMTEYVDSGGAVTGGAAGDPLGRQLAVCVTFKTNKSGKSYRGRAFLGGFTEADATTGSACSTALANACDAFLEAVRTNLTANGFTQAILSPALPERLNHKGETLPPKPAFFENVTNTLVRTNIWATQRRRTHRP